MPDDGIKTIPGWTGEPDWPTGCEFQRPIFERSLGDDVGHCLVFTLHGDHSLVLPYSNDGVVNAASELRTEAQADAHLVRGFDATHTNVLHQSAAVNLVEDRLDGDRTEIK